MSETIKCNFCRELKPASEFKKTSGKKCRSCRNEYMKNYFRNQKDPLPKPHKQEPQLHGLCSRKTRARILLQRNRNPIDRELYVDNKTWIELDNLGWMNFDRLFKYKMEELTVEYWEDFHYKMQQQALSGGRYGDWIRKDEIIYNRSEPI